MEWLDKSKALRDGSLSSAVMVLVALAAHSLHVSAETAGAAMTVAFFAVPFGYRILRHNWPWLLARDPE